MKYEITATVVIPAGDEEALASLIGSIKTFTSNNNGNCKLLIRTQEKINPAE